MPIKEGKVFVEWLADSGDSDHKLNVGILFLFVID
jgi:hypothetical protein